MQDFVIRKADGMPTYHFAVVVDDAEMGVTHVLRGQEHTKNTFNHIALQEALGYPRPTYGHLPIILNPDGSKMGKRDRDKKIRQRAQAVAEEHEEDAGRPRRRLRRLRRRASTTWLERLQDSSSTSPSSRRSCTSIGLQRADLPEILVHDFRKNGYLPEVLLNFLALLGWNPGGDQERMTHRRDGRSSSRSTASARANAKFDRDEAARVQHRSRRSGDAASGCSPAFKDYLSVNPDSPLNAATDDAARASCWR